MYYADAFNVHTQPGPVIVVHPVFCTQTLFCVCAFFFSLFWFRFVFRLFTEKRSEYVLCRLVVRGIIYLLGRFYLFIYFFCNFGCDFSLCLYAVLFQPWPIVRLLMLCVRKCVGARLQMTAVNWAESDDMAVSFVRTYVSVGHAIWMNTNPHKGAQAPHLST